MPRSLLLAGVVSILAVVDLVAQDAPKPKRIIPADAGQAAAVLVESPRHGEWVDVPLVTTEAASAVKLHTWISYPERDAKAAVVIVIHEIFGMTDWVRAVADQLAADGFIAIAPDLLSGLGKEGGGTESFAGDQVRDAIRKLGRDQIVQRLDAVRDFALALPSATAKSASLGFCWGGTASFTYATAQPKLDAAVVYYGSAPVEKAVLAKITCPVAGFYGGDDARVTTTVEPTRLVLTELKKVFTPYVFAGAGHGFMRQQTQRDGANAKAAEQAWRETVAFLRKQLEPTLR